MPLHCLVAAVAQLLRLQAAFGWHYFNSMMVALAWWQHCDRANDQLMNNRLDWY